MGVEAFESVSSWSQPTPDAASSVRSELIDEVARRVIAVRPGRIRVVVDGYTASGKTSFAHELAAAIRRHGRSTVRASFDDFKKPWRDAREKGYDRSSGDGYYRNSPDFESARELLLRPAGVEGSGTVVLCGHDPLTGEDHRNVTVDVPIEERSGVFSRAPADALARRCDRPVRPARPARRRGSPAASGSRDVRPRTSRFRH